MAPKESTTIDAGGRELRVSSADRVIFPATERTAAVTKLDIVEYYVSVEDGIMRALARRPTTLERWPKGVHPGIVLSTRQQGGGDAFFQKRIPRGAPDYVETTRITFPVISSFVESGLSSLWLSSALAKRARSSTVE